MSRTRWLLVSGDYPQFSDSLAIIGRPEKKFALSFLARDHTLCEKVLLVFEASNLGTNNLVCLTRTTNK